MESFLPGGHSFMWRPDILWLHVISDGLIALAYFLIPIGLVLLYRTTRQTHFRWALGMFAGFIFIGGVSHVITIVTVWNPIYLFEGISKAVAAAFSLATAIIFLPIAYVIATKR